MSVFIVNVGPFWYWLWVTRSCSIYYTYRRVHLSKESNSLSPHNNNNNWIRNLFCDFYTPLTIHSIPLPVMWTRNSLSFSIKPQKFTHRKLQKCTQIKITFKAKTFAIYRQNEDSSELRDNFFHLSKSLVSSTY